MLRHRAAGAKWLRLRGIQTHPDNVILCNGSQEGLMAVLATVTKPGDAVLTESLNYAGVKRLADLFRLDIRGVPPTSMVCGRTSCWRPPRDLVSALFCVRQRCTTRPTPPCRWNGGGRSDDRPKLDTIVIEDDSNGHLSGDETPTLTSLNPDRCIYLCGTSKSMAPGLRIGYMLPPTGHPAAG